MNKAQEFGKRIVKGMADPSKRRIMTETETMVMVILMSEQDTQHGVDFRARLDSAFPVAVLTKRLEGCLPGHNIHPDAIRWIGACCQSPADAVMQAAVFAYLETDEFKQTCFNDGGPTDLTTLTHNVYPMGVPNRDFLSQMWDSQKGGEQMGGNLLDTTEWWVADAPTTS